MLSVHMCTIRGFCYVYPIHHYWDRVDWISVEVHVFILCLCSLEDEEALKESRSYPNQVSSTHHHHCAGA